MVRCVIVRKDQGLPELNVFRELADGDIAIWTRLEQGWGWKTYSAGEAYAPTLLLPMGLGQEGVLVELREALRAALGEKISDEERGVLGGKLEATRAHLEDLRTVLFGWDHVDVRHGPGFVGVEENASPGV